MKGDVEKMDSPNTTFRKRGFFSLATFLFFVLMTITGLVAYIAPHGRIAYWTHWQFLGLSKTNWGDMHTVTSVLFILVGGFHLFYNWKAFVNYIFKKASKTFNLKKEMTAVLLLSIFAVASSLYHIPPLSYLVDFSNQIKESWIISKEYEPPFGHAEELSLKVFAKKMKIDLDRAISELQANNIMIDDPKATLDSIAMANHTTPMHLYAMIKKYQVKAQVNPEKTYTSEMVEEEFAGSGLGRKTLQQVCEEIGIETGQAEEKLLEHEMIIAAEENLKSAAERYGVNPIDFLKIILIDKNDP